MILVTGATGNIGSALLGTVATVTGTPARPFEQWVAENAAAFR
ncbi:hypothetical protein ABZX88_23000 [Kitasatospora aureofaciens]|nr:hypothetical protein [Kitasatospora aureofaciens]